MEFLIAGLIFLVVVGVILFVPLPKQFRGSGKPRRTRKYRTSGAILGAVNEVFNPSAANAAVIQEEKRVSRKANPSPEDGLL